MLALPAVAEPEPAPRTSPPADLLPVQRKATLAYRLLRFILLPVFHVLFVFLVKGQQRIPSKGPYVLIANHLNWLDSFLILASFPAEPRIHFLGDPYGLETHRVQWAVVRAVGGYIPVNNREGSGPRLYRHVDLCLQRGGVVALYPEGHYGAREARVDEFKKGFAHFAIDNNVPVLPVALSGTKDLWWRKKVRAFIGDPISPQGHTVESLVEEGHASLQALLPEYHEPFGPKPLRRKLTNLF
jgi:1-acyl-sn-glycerol-3-phosphate acyltransferase